MTHSPVRRALRRARRAPRSGLLRVASRFAPAGDAGAPDLSRLRRILLVAVHGRLGNTVLATPGVRALTEACPAAEIDLLGGRHAPEVFPGFGLREVRAVSRRDTLSPARLVAHARRLRAERYEAAIHLSTATGSVGALLTGLSGAAHRIGCLRESGNVWFTTAVPPPSSRHKIDALREYLSHLGVPVPGERELRLTRAEVDWAEDWLAAREGAERRPRVGIFFGGRAWQGKGWDLANFAAVSRGLSANGIRPVLLPGPEERGLAEALAARFGEALTMDEPGIRKAAAIARCCGAVLTPDSGPMHLSVAVGTPVVAIFRRANAAKWGPAPEQGCALHDPEGAEAEAALEALLAMASSDRRGSPAGARRPHSSGAAPKRSSSRPL